ncbi:diacylglycerol/lipid kinase family protein [Acidobacteriota bacterium]
MNKRKALFIINPKSGQQRGKSVAHTLEKKLDRSLYDWNVYYTKGPGDAAIKSKDAANKMDTVIAVGGDGSVNEVARGLIGSKSVLGIIPVGSGNGLARYLKIPMRIPNAIDLLNKGHIKKIDTLMINDELMLNTAGVGFDARVAHEYSRYVHRGISSYIKSVLKEIPHYQERKYKFYFENESVQVEAFLLTFSNSSQYGNNFYISPQAKIDDGYFEVCLIKKFPPWIAPIIILRLLNKTIDQSKYYTCYKCKELVLDLDEGEEAHIDGEAVTLPKKIMVKLNPHSLKVITG